MLEDVAPRQSSLPWRLWSLSGTCTSVDLAADRGWSALIFLDPASSMALDLQQVARQCFLSDEQMNE